MTTLKEFAMTRNLNGFGSIIKLGPPLIGYSKLAKDTIKYPYWRLDDSEWDKDVQALWEEGKVILNHAITIDRIVMTKDQAVKYIQHPDSKVISDFMDFMKIERDIQEAMHKESDEASASGSPVGFILTRGVADGYATYKVVKATAKSVWIELRKFGDGYVDQFFGVEYKMSRDDFMRISRFGKPPLAFLKSPFA